MTSPTSGLRASRDIRPLTEFRANAAAFIEQVQSTQEPIVITQRGRCAAVLICIQAYETLVDEAELLHDVRTAESQAAADGGEPRDRVEARLRARLGR